HHRRHPPVSDLTVTPPADTLAQPAPWRFWGTLAWGVAAFVVFYLIQFAALLVLVIWWHADPTAPTADLKTLGSNAIVLSVLTLASVPATLLVVALAVKLARSRFVDYLALKPVDV